MPFKYFNYLIEKQLIYEKMLFFVLEFHEDKYIIIDIDQSLNNYKEVSSKNYDFSKIIILNRLHFI